MDGRLGWIPSNLPFTLGILSFFFQVNEKRVHRAVIFDPRACVLSQAFCQIPSTHLLQAETMSPGTQLTVMWRDAPGERLGASGVWGKMAMLNTRLSRWAWASVALDTCKDTAHCWASGGQSMLACVYFFPFEPSVFEFCMLLYYNFHSALHILRFTFLLIIKKIPKHFRQLWSCRKV